MTRRPRIVVLGSVHMDLIAHADRLPERARSGLALGFSMNLGGKGGHQAIQCVAAGADTMMITQLGDDAFGQELLGQLKQHRVDCTHVSILKSGKTGVSAVLSAPEGYTSLIFPGAASEMTSDDVAARVRRAAPFDILLLQLELPLSVSIAAAKAAKEMGARVVLNAAPPSQQIEALMTFTDVLVVNEAEAQAMAGSENARELADTFKVLAVITKGADGSSASDGQSEWFQSAEPVKTTSTLGAGDAFLAGFCVSFCTHRDVPAALQAGAKVAAQRLISADRR
jgi:ribokinase